MPRHERRPFCLYVDEFQAIATSSFVEMLPEARKFRLSFVLAKQFIEQIEAPASSGGFSAASMP